SASDALRLDPAGEKPPELGRIFPLQRFGRYVGAVEQHAAGTLAEARAAAVRVEILEPAPPDETRHGTRVRPRNGRHHEAAQHDGELLQAVDRLGAGIELLMDAADRGERGAPSA